MYICVQHGYPLNGSLETIDLPMELQNFESVGGGLAKVANRQTISGSRVFSRYDPPEDPKKREIRILSQVFKVFKTEAELEHFKARHYSESQYLGQFTKCEQRHGLCKICKPVRSDYFKLLRLSNNYPYLPTTVALQVKDGRHRMAARNDKQTKETNFTSFTTSLIMTLPRNLTQDTFCPRVSDSDSKKRTCACGRYHCSISGKERHRKSKALHSFAQKTH